MMNNTHRFDEKGEIYAASRPRYAEGLFAFLRDELALKEGSVFADVGSGTGIFTEQLLSHGYEVRAVEPNADMRRTAERLLAGRAGFTSVCGSDAETGLAAHSVDAVSAAQAFHWFDSAAFLRECRRILKPDGVVVIAYNSRCAEAECNRRLAEVNRRYCPNFSGFSNGMSDDKCHLFFAQECRTFRADNSQIYDKSGFISRALSASYSLREGDKEYDAYLAAIGEVFDGFAVGERLTVPMLTLAYAGGI